MRNVFNFILINILFLTGCDFEVKYRDVSQQKKYIELIGQRYEIKNNLIAYGIRKNSKKPIDYITLMPAPGIGGTQVGYEKIIESKSIIKVEQVFVTNRIFDSPITLKVELENEILIPSIPIYIDLMRGNEGSSDLSLNPIHYQKIN